MAPDTALMCRDSLVLGARSGFACSGQRLVGAVAAEAGAWPSWTEQGLGLAKLSPWSSGAAKSTSLVAIASDISAVLNYRS